MLLGQGWDVQIGINTWRKGSSDGGGWVWSDAGEGKKVVDLFFLLTFACHSTHTTLSLK